MGLCLSLVQSLFTLESFASFTALRELDVSLWHWHERSNVSNNPKLQLAVSLTGAAHCKNTCTHALFVKCASLAMSMTQLGHLIVVEQAVN